MVCLDSVLSGRKSEACGTILPGSLHKQTLGKECLCLASQKKDPQIKNHSNILQVEPRASWTRTDFPFIRILEVPSSHPFLRHPANLVLHFYLPPNPAWVRGVPQLQTTKPSSQVDAPGNVKFDMYKPLRRSCVFACYKPT